MAASISVTLSIPSNALIILFLDSSTDILYPTLPIMAWANEKLGSISTAFFKALSITGL